MAEIIADGYQSIRDFINGSTSSKSWNYIAIYDDSKAEDLRLSVTGDSRFSWTDADGDAILKVDGTLSGSDGDVTLGTTYEYAALFDDTSANSGTRVTTIEQFATANIDQSGDTVSITLTIEVPQQV